MEEKLFRKDQKRVQCKNKCPDVFRGLKMSQPAEHAHCGKILIIAEVM